MIESPDDPQLDQLVQRLRAMATEQSYANDAWPREQLEHCGRAGFYRWFVNHDHGGLEWSAADIARGYLALSSACLTTTFILTQRVAALRRIAGCGNEKLIAEQLPKMLTGEVTATVGISHLTTSRQHVKRPVLRATATTDGFRVDGFSPWVTGGQGADYVLMGADVVGADDLATGEQILFMTATNDPRVRIDPGFNLVALSASQTGQVHCDGVDVATDHIVAGPIADVLGSHGGGAGGLQTSVLALGLTKAAIDFIESESSKRSELSSTQHALREQLDHLARDLYAATEAGEPGTAAEIRSQANSLALRATQAALVVAKGAGFVTGHPTGRWCQEALFFLVWSCPQAVANANLSQFAGCEV